MISASEFRNGATIEYEGDIFVILEFQHVKPGKGAAFVRTKIKNLKTGSVVEKTFRPTEKMPRAHIDRLDMQYLYNDGDLYHFMNTETFEQIAVNAEQIGDTLKFVKENEMVKILSYEGEVFGIEPPLFVELVCSMASPKVSQILATFSTFSSESVRPGTSTKRTQIFLPALARRCPNSMVGASRPPVTLW